MRIERKWLDTIFHRVTPETVFQSVKDDQNLNSNKFTALYNNFHLNTFSTFSADLFKNYTQDEINNIYEMMINTANSNDYCPKSVFNLLVSYANKVLLTDDNYPICKYDEILNWREMTNKLGQNIFTTAYLAYQDISNCEETTVFSWRPVIKTNNNRLHRLLDKGMAENHFHLNGSTQVFTLSWISAMNHFNDISKMCRKFDKPLFQDVLYTRNFGNQITKQLKQAAIIRQYLFKIIVGLKDKEDNERKELIDCLDDSLLCDINDKITALRLNFGYKTNFTNKILDYALLNNLNENNYNCNRALVGERYFMYHCFRKIFSNRFNNLQCNLFYLYLVIKANFRSELVQSNEKVGFTNFKYYQDRKSCLYDRYDTYCYEAVNLAINSTCEDQNILSLESRIMVKKTNTELKNEISFYDNTQLQTYNSCNLDSFDIYNTFTKKHLDELPQKEKDKKFFYVLHYPKAKTIALRKMIISYLNTDIINLKKLI